MKNLKLASSLSIDLSLQSEDETLILYAFDIERNRLFFASSANFVYSFALPSPRKGNPWSKSSLPTQFASIITLETGEFVTAMDYSMEKEDLIIGTSDGSLILHSMDDSGIEVVGRVEGGVKFIACSPDGALVAITSGMGKLIVMTIDWEVLYESSLNFKIDAMGDTKGYDGLFQALISWRGDGKFFATLGGFHEYSSKKLMIWEHNSDSPHSETEAKDFAGEALDWMPSGAKITVAYNSLSGAYPLIAFFEKNGLERSSFCAGEQAEIRGIKWNRGSDLLAVLVVCSQHEAIKIWHFANGHWYLKREMRYKKREGVKCEWDPTKEANLICWTVNGRITTYDFVWTTAMTENSVAFVVDGSRLLVSPLIISLMPPPMSLFRLKFPAAIQDVAFIYSSTNSTLATSLSDGSLCILELSGGIDTWVCYEDQELRVETLRLDFLAVTFEHIAWLDSRLLIGISCNRDAPICQDSNDSKYHLLEIEIGCSNDLAFETVKSVGWHAKIARRLPLERPVIGIISNPCKKASVLVQMEGGSIFEYSTERQNLVELDFGYGFITSCPWMKAAIFCENGLMKSMLMGLDYDGNLYCGKRVLCGNCSGFTLYSRDNGEVTLTSDLILTLKHDSIFIIGIYDILHGEKEIKIEDFSGGGHIMWERGAKLIGALHGDKAAVILQANRGSLECIFPRKLVLDSVRNALAQRRFKDALAIARRHRIDLNFVVDCFGWSTFVDSAAEFVDRVGNIAHITELVTSIKGGNVMDNLYKYYLVMSPYDQIPSLSIEKSSFGVEGKVNSVLRAIRKALEERVPESSERELCILSTLARYEPPALEEALNRIKYIREIEILNVEDSKRLSYPSAEESLKHLLWLADTEAVFEAALGLYDLNLAAMVAMNSQKDPKEFLPYLEELENMVPIVTKFTIDLRLQRYESALKHMFSAGEEHHDECLKLMKKKPHLFPLGLHLFESSNRRGEVFEAWGDHLCDEKCFHDAASAYLCCSSRQKALKAYRGCGDWKSALIVAATLAGADKTGVIQLANELCDEFQALGKPAEAARIALDYCKDVDRCVGCYIIAREWEEALRICYLNERADLMSQVENAALECANFLMSEYEEALEKVGKYVVRYLAVRQRRIVLAAKIQLESGLSENTDYDSVSEISSNFSGMSVYTTRTTKNSISSTGSTTTSKARETKRKASKQGKIRAGSPGEEVALIEHLKGMHLTSGAQQELKTLLAALLMLGKDEIARQLQRAADTFELTQHSAVKLADRTAESDWIDESTHTLDYHIKQEKGEWRSQEAHSWRVRVLTSIASQKG